MVDLDPAAKDSDIDLDDLATRQHDHDMLTAEQFRALVKSPQNGRSKGVMFIATGVMV